MKTKRIAVESNFHTARGSAWIKIPKDKTFPDYLLDLEYACSGVPSDIDARDRRRLHHIETLFCSKQSGCGCGIREVER